MRFQAGQVHVKRASSCANAGNSKQALVEFQKAICDRSFFGDRDAGNQAHHGDDGAQPEKGIFRTRIRGSPPAELERKEAEGRVASLQPCRELKPITNQISTLEDEQPASQGACTRRWGNWRASTWSSILSIRHGQERQSGPDQHHARRGARLYRDADQDVLEADQPNTIFVAEDNVTKRRDYEDQVVKVFYLKNVTSVQEFQEIVDRGAIGDGNSPHVHLQRAECDDCAAGRWIRSRWPKSWLQDLDKPKSEVVVDVMVMQVNSERTRDLAAGLVSGGHRRIDRCRSASPHAALTTTTHDDCHWTGDNYRHDRRNHHAQHGYDTPLHHDQRQRSQLAQIGDGVVQRFLDYAARRAAAGHADATAGPRCCNRPQVRASDGQKVTLKIGDKDPVRDRQLPAWRGHGGRQPAGITQFNFAESA